MMLRAVGVLFVVFYVIVPFISMTPEEIEEISPVFRYGTIAFFTVACIAISALTIFEHVKNKKTGKYEASAYTDDEVEGENSERE